jgi:hypothetical protein
MFGPDLVAGQLADLHPFLGRGAFLAQILRLAEESWARKSSKPA